MFMMITYGIYTKNIVSYIIKLKKKCVPSSKLAALIVKLTEIHKRWEDVRWCGRYGVQIPRQSNLPPIANNSPHIQ